MEPALRQNRKRSEDLRSLPQAKEQAYEGRYENSYDQSGNSYDTHSKRKNKSKTDEGFVKKYGTLLFYASLGYAVGYLITNVRNKRVQRKERSHPNTVHGTISGRYEQRGRMKHRPSNDRYALTGPSVRGHSLSRSSRYPWDHDTHSGYWR